MAPPAAPAAQVGGADDPGGSGGRAAFAALDAAGSSDITDTLRAAMQAHFDPRILEALSTLPRQTGAATLRG
ncbi:MAG: hypothetical protein U0133_04370 [Gemmatimonadales bacterium]